MWHTLGMTSDEIAKRFVACGRWRWMPGMRAKCTLIEGAVGLILDEADDAGRVLMCDADPTTNPSTRDRIEPSNYTPDPENPATLGCIEHGLLADIYGPECTLWHTSSLGSVRRPFVTPGSTTLGGYCYGRHGMAFGSGPTKAAALVDALETKL